MLKDIKDNTIDLVFYNIYVYNIGRKKLKGQAGVNKQNIINKKQGKTQEPITTVIFLYEMAKTYFSKLRQQTLKIKKQTNF